MAKTLAIGDELYLVVPVRRYVRPNGTVHREEFYIGWTSQLEQNLDAMLVAGYHVTLEAVAENSLNVCVEDDERDFEYQIVKNDSREPVEVVTSFIGDYDAARYQHIKDTEPA